MNIDLESVLSLAENMDGEDERIKFRALEKHGLECFVEAVSEVASREEDRDKRAAAYLDAKNIELRIVDRQNIPAKGPILVVSNHRLGALDGILMEALLGTIRPDRKMLSISNFSPLLEGRIIEVDLRTLAGGVPSAETVEKKRSTRLEIIHHMQTGGCLGVFPGSGITVFDPETGVQSDAPYVAFAFLIEILRSMEFAVVPVFVDCQFRKGLFKAYSTTDWEFFALQWGEINQIKNRSIPIYVGEPIIERKGDSWAQVELIHDRVHQLPAIHRAEAGGAGSSDSSREPDRHILPGS